MGPPFSHAHGTTSPLFAPAVCDAAGRGQRRSPVSGRRPGRGCASGDDRSGARARSGSPAGAAPRPIPGGSRAASAWRARRSGAHRLTTWRGPPRDPGSSPAAPVMDVARLPQAAVALLFDGDHDARRLNVVGHEQEQRRGALDQSAPAHSAGGGASPRPSGSNQAPAPAAGRVPRCRPSVWRTASVANSQAAMNQTGRGARVRCEIVPAATELRSPQLEHTTRPSARRQPPRCAHSGHTKQFGQRSHSR